MARIVVLGGTGYAGSAIAKEAASRGHDVVVFGRSTPADLPDGVTSVKGSVLVSSELEAVVAGADVIVVSLAPAGDLETEFVRINADIASLAQAQSSRLGVVGGSGTLLTPDGGKTYESPHFPESFRGFSKSSDGVLQALRASNSELDWFVLSPPRAFGSYIPGETTGHYRVGGDTALSAGEHPAAISGPDFALAFVDEIDEPSHRRQRFTVAH